MAIEEALPRDIAIMQQSNPEYFYEMLPYLCFMQFSQYEIWATEVQRFKVSANWFVIAKDASMASVSNGDDVETTGSCQFERTIEAAHNVINAEGDFLSSEDKYFIDIAS